MCGGGRIYTVCRKRTYIQRNRDPKNRQEYGCPALPSLCFLTWGAIRLHQSSSEQHQTEEVITQSLPPSPENSPFFTPLYQPVCFSPPNFSLFLVPIVLKSAKFETPAKNGETASILSCTVHWLMSGTGHCVSRYRKCALSCLSCQYPMVHTKCHSRLDAQGRRSVLCICHMPDRDCTAA